jgi:hypothetical protein
MRSVGPFIRLIIFLLLSYAVPASGDDRQARDGFLAVTVTRGEERSPESRADVFVHGYRPVYLGELSALLSQTKEGVCEASLAPGIYDVFISSPSMLPTCTRVVIVAGQRQVFYENRKLDIEHMEK